MRIGELEEGQYVIIRESIWPFLKGYITAKHKAPKKIKRIDYKHDEVFLYGFKKKFRSVEFLKTVTKDEHPEYFLLITKHKIEDYDVDGGAFGVVCLAQGNAGTAQKIFHILESTVDDPNWYMDKFVTAKGCKNPKGLTSKSHQNIGNFKNQKETPMKVFELFPEAFL